MVSPIDFYFDFSSPYGYLASEKIDALAAKHAREVNWRPYLLGVAFKATGGAPLTTIPIKGAYHLRDMIRTAKYLGVAYRHPSPFPVSAVTPTRAFYWLEASDPKSARQLAHALFRAYFVGGIDISSADNTVAVCAQLGLNPESARAALADPAVKDRTRFEVDKALALGAFGSPYIVVDGEPFWGSDRLDQVDKWLETGGW